MIKVDPYSGRTYITTGNVKQTTDGETFIKTGDMWISDKGSLVQEQNGEQQNLKTGIRSSFGDAFWSDDDEI